MKVEQVSVKYNAVEDRLHIIVTTSERQQFNYWMTRNIAKQVLPLLNQYFDVEQLKVSAQLSDSDKKEVKKIQHQKMLEDVEFVGEQGETPEQKAERESLEIMPTLLLEKVVLSPLESEKIILGLTPSDPDKGLQFTMTMKFMHSLYQLFINAIKRADWDLSLELLSLDINTESTSIMQSKIDAKKLN